MKNYLDYIKEFWHIATIKTPFYEYVLIDIELRERKGVLSSILHYRAIGARTVEQASASELNDSALFCKFSPLQSQMIVILATLESILSTDKDEIKSKYLEYAKKCTKLIRFR